MVSAVARDGDAGAQYLVGTMYANGKGTPVDDVEARKWYRLAAENGIGRAQYLIGQMYETR